MAQEEAQSAPEPQVRPWRPAVDGGTLLRAVERVGADVAALSRLLASQPEEVAARVDVDAATAAIGVRVGALASTLDHLRLTLLASLDRTTDRLESPPWLPQLESRIGEMASRIEAVAEQADQAPVLEAIAELATDPRLAELTTTVSRLADDPRLDRLTAPDRPADDSRLDQLTTTLERMAEDHLAEGRRLDALAAAVASLSDGVRAGAAVADALEHVGERLSAVAAQVDRITPLARAGDEAGSLLGQLDRVSASLEAVVGQLGGGGAAGPSGAVGGGDREDEDQLDALVEVLAGVTRRQDEVTAAVTTVLDQVRGPMGVDAVLDHMEQRERSLAGRLDRIDGELRRRSEQPAPPSSAQAAPRPDDTARALRTVLERLDHQERAVAGQLEWIVQRLATPPVPASEAAETASFGEVLADISRRQDELAAAIDRRLSAIESGLAPSGRPPGLPPTSAEAAALRLAQLRAERARVQAHLRDERLLAAQAWDGDDLEE